jgi:hypothetical protein
LVDGGRSLGLKGDWSMFYYSMVRYKIYIFTQSR